MFLKIVQKQLLFEDSIQFLCINCKIQFLTQFEDENTFLKRTSKSRQGPAKGLNRTYDTKVVWLMFLLEKSFADDLEFVDIIGVWTEKRYYLKIVSLVTSIPIVWNQYNSNVSTVRSNPNSVWIRKYVPKKD